MLFSSQTYVVEEKPKTSAKHYADLKKGDHLQFSLELKNKAHHRGRSYATEVLIENLTQKTKWTNTQNLFVNNLKRLKLRPHEPEFILKF